MSRQTPSPELREAYDRAMTDARSPQPDAAWAAIERAHVLSQPWAPMHVRVHVEMLRLGIRERDLREVAGQLTRLLVAAPGSWTGRYPVGNSGRARVSMWKPMRLPEEVKQLVG